MCRYPIPIGMAATTRIFSYSKGLVNLGNYVCVYSAIPRPNNSFPCNGSHDGIDFKYCTSYLRSNNLFIRAFNILVSNIASIVAIYKDNRKIGFDRIIVSSDIISLLYLCTILKRIIKLPLIFIFDEFPRPIRGKLKDKLPKYKVFAYRNILKRYSGYISISRTLSDFYNTICPRKTLILSTIVNDSRFHEAPIRDKTSKDHFNITYLGNMELSKDNVDNIIKAFSLIFHKYDCSLLLYGKPSIKDKLFLDGIIKEKGIEKFVSFNFSEYSQVPEVLCKSDILVSSQPVTKRASGGFPTKVGEYLCTGNPVLLTDVGETSKFFINGQHIFFASPENPNDFADKISYIIDNYSLAQTVGRQGMKEVKSRYTITSAGQQMHNFLSAIN